MQAGGVAMSHAVCTAIRENFSAYLDGAISGHEMQEISRHIEGQEDAAGCAACARELAAWRLTQSVVCGLGPAKAPAELGLRLRVAISRERARRSVGLLDRLSLAWDNGVRMMVVQVSAGFAGAVVLVGGIVLLLGMVAAPKEVMADDEPLSAVTAPHYRYSTVPPAAIAGARGGELVVEASVDRKGRVYDFTILSGPQDATVRSQVASELLGSVFEPASAFGVPIRGHVIVTYSGIYVRG
jgi:anti-sigma factor RsiW